MTYNFGIFFLFVVFKSTECTLQSYISDGTYAKYSQYPHSVLLFITCEYTMLCGGSVLNQQMVLTAAHCLEVCEGVKKIKIDIMYGHENMQKMNKTLMSNYVVHARYDANTVINDICILLTKDKIPLNDVVKRIIVMDHPPPGKHAYVAGWGMDENEEMTIELKHTGAWLQPADVCSEVMGEMPRGLFCAGPITGIGTPQMGDSGGALIMDEYIQIGVVSYSQKFTDDIDLVGYTNVSYYIKWIRKTTKRLYCQRRVE